MLFASLSQRLDCINDRYEPNLISAASGLANEDFCGPACTSGLTGGLLLNRRLNNVSAH